MLCCSNIYFFSICSARVGWKVGGGNDTKRKVVLRLLRRFERKAITTRIWPWPSAGHNTERNTQMERQDFEFIEGKWRQRDGGRSNSGGKVKEEWIILSMDGGKSANKHQSGFGKSAFVSQYELKSGTLRLYICMTVWFVAKHHGILHNKSDMCGLAICVECELGSSTRSLR